MIKLNKILTVVAIVSIATTRLSAQSYTTSPTDTIETATSFDILKVLTFTQVHTAADTVLLAWQKLSVSKPSTWEISLCDYAHCYTTLPDSGQMDPILPGDDGLISLHVKAHDTNGTAVIRCAVWDLKNTAHRDTLTWIINCYPTAVNNFTANNFLVYAHRKTIYLNNPNTVYTQVMLCDLTGKMVFNSPVFYDKQAFDLSYLNDDMYILILNGEKRTEKQKIFLTNQ